MKNLITLLFFTVLTINLNCNAATLSDRNTVSFASDFNFKSVTKLQSEINEKHLALPKTEAINIVIYSPGGSIVAGNSLIQFMNDLDRRFNLICKFCASMAFHTFQGIKDAHRFLPSDGVLMTHKARGGFSGSFPGQVDAIYALWLNIIKKMDKQVVSQTNGNHTLKSYRKLYANDYWCNASECIAEGFADQVVPVTCDKSMSGTKSSIIRFFGKKIRIYENKCPLIRGIVDYEILDGKNLDDTDLDDIDSYVQSLSNSYQKLMLERDSEQIKRINNWNKNNQ